MESHYIDYDALVDTIKIEDITSDEYHQDLLRQIKKYDPDLTHLSLSEDREEWSYCPDDVRELGWLGYFIGNNTHLRYLSLQEVYLLNSAGALEVFCRGVNSNISIKELDFYGLSQFHMNRMLGAIMPIFGTNNITQLAFVCCSLGAVECRQLSLAIGGHKMNKSLKSFVMDECDIDGRHMVEVISVLMHPQLDNLELGLEHNSLGRNCCFELEEIMRSKTNDLQTLRLPNNDFDDKSATILARGLSHSTSLRCLDLSDTNIRDEGVRALVSALKSSKLKTLSLSSCPSITANGWKSISTLLECPNCNLESLTVYRNPIGDEEAMYFAGALARNSTLERLTIWDTPGSDSITARGVNAFARLLCDTSSANDTYHSNHTLSYMGSMPLDTQYQSVQTSLDLNRRRDKQKVAIMKILLNHPDISMLPLLKWDLKVLPLVLDWYERAAECILKVDPYGYSNPLHGHPFDKRRFSTLYECVRGAPIHAISSGLVMEERSC